MGKTGSGGQLQNMACEGSLMGLSSPGTAPHSPLGVWEVGREMVVVLMFGSGGVATGLTTAAFWTRSPLSAKDGEEALALGGSMANIWVSSSTHLTRSLSYLRIDTIRTLLIHY